MIRTHTGKSVQQIRRELPDAAIIRWVERGMHLSFDTAAEAIGHPTTKADRT